MKLVIGLGNPGQKYEGTRHNAGIMAVQEYLNSGQVEADWKEQKKFKSLVFERAGIPKAVFAFPQTYMNNSGEATSALVDYFKIKPETELLVVHDEIDLPLGTVRISHDVSAAGHNGVSDIILKLGNQAFRRLRIGIESRKNQRIPPTEDFVLKDFTAEELEVLKESSWPHAKKAIQEFLIA